MQFAWGTGLLQAASVQELAAVKAAGSTRRLHRGETIITQGVTPAGVWLIEWGCFRLEHLRADGVKQVLAFGGDGSVFGLTPYFLKAPADVSVVAMEMSLVGLLPYAAFESLLARNHAVTIAVSRCLATQVAEQQTATTRLYRLPLRARFADVLFMLQGAFGGPAFAARRSDLADLMGCTESSIARLVTEFVDGGLIKRLAGSYIQVMCPEALALELGETKPPPKLAAVTC